jgi:hypothetical protein
MPRGEYRARQKIIDRALDLANKIALVHGKYDDEGEPLSVIIDHEIKEVFTAVRSYQYLMDGQSILDNDDLFSNIESCLKRPPKKRTRKSQRNSSKSSVKKTK